MAKYIQQENQRLLWNVAQNIPLLHQVHPTMGAQEKWFKTVIQTFYEKNRNVTLNRSALENLNRQTVEYMKDNLHILQTSYLYTGKTGIPRRKVNFGKNRLIPPDPDDTELVVPASTTWDGTPSTASAFRDIPAEHRDEWNLHLTPRPRAPIFENRTVSNNVLENRQREYDTMLNRPTPPEPNFREVVQDPVIENMDELIQQQLRQRELDVATFAPPTAGILPPPPPPPPPPTATTGRPRKTKNVEIRESIALTDVSNNVVIELEPNGNASMYSADFSTILTMLKDIQDELKVIREKLDQ